jgi:hypothetical protein
MDEIAINFGWAFCTILLIAPADACNVPDHARFLGTVLLGTGMFGISIATVLQIGRLLAAPRERDRRRTI